MIIIDIHAHLIPGVDDGAKSQEEALALLQSQYDQGVRQMIVTPHYRRELFECDQDRIEKRFLWLQKKALEMGADYRLYLGNEIHYHSDILESLTKKKCTTLASSTYLLVEFSSMHGYSFLKEALYHLQVKGFHPILAHIERYPCIIKHMERVEELREMGVGIQVNADSLLGLEGIVLRRFTHRLMKKEWIDYVASDAHRIKGRTSHIKQCMVLVKKKAGADYAKQIFYENQLDILRDRKGHEGIAYEHD